MNYETRRIPTLRIYENEHKRLLIIWEKIKKEILSTNKTTGLESYSVKEENDELIVKVIDVKVFLKFTKKNGHGNVRYYCNDFDEKISIFSEIPFDFNGNIGGEGSFLGTYENFSEIHMNTIRLNYEKLVSHHYSKGT